MDATPARTPVSIDGELAALAAARGAVVNKLRVLDDIDGGGADALADEYIDAVVRGAIEKLQQELVVFGRIDDDQPWRVGLYGIDEDGDQLVIDWRAPFAGAFYQARLDDPLGLERRVTYVGAITDLFIEDFASGEISGSSPLLGELSRSRGTEMRAAVATLQSEQDGLVRLDPTAKLVLRGGPGTGKTVVGLHRAAWLVYNDRRLTAGRILVVGPSDKFLRFVSAVLPTLGEARIAQTTMERLLGRSTPSGSDPRWLEILDRFEAGLLTPGEIQVGLTRIRIDEVTELMDRIGRRAIPWRDRRKAFVTRLANAHGLKAGEVSKAATGVWPPLSTKGVMARLRSRPLLAELGMEAEMVERWLEDPVDGALLDEVRSRVEGVPATYGHVIVDEAQDLSLLQLRAMERRSTGLTLVGDDAQRSAPASIGLRAVAAHLKVQPAEMTTAYRMSAEIANWLNGHADAYAIDAVELLGIRPTGVAVSEVPGDRSTAQDHLVRLEQHWPNVALITAEDTWSHKGVEYDAVAVDTAGMDAHQIYLAASRAAHQLVIIHPA